MKSNEEHQCVKMLELFKRLSPKSREAIIRLLDKKVTDEKVQNKPASKALKPERLKRMGQPTVIEEWKDEKGNMYQFVEANDGLTHQQRLDAVTEILAGIALRIMKKKQGR